MEHPACRFIIQGPAGAAWNMAVDEAISDSCRDQLSPSTLRFYRFRHPSVTIGRFQKIDPPPLAVLSKERTLPVIRRITGGRAVFHDADLTFSFSSGRFSTGPGLPGVPKRPRESFLTIIGCIQAAFLSLGLDTRWGKSDPTQVKESPDCFTTPTSFELLFKGQKILGCAQRRWKNGLLLQGSIRLNAVHGNLPIESLRNGGALFALRVVSEFERSMNTRFVASDLTALELRKSRTLKREKYLNPTWNRDAITGRKSEETTRYIIDNSVKSARI